MSPKERSITVRLEPAMAEAMEAVQERFGTPFSEQVRRGLAEWLEKQGFKVKTERKRVATRKRS
jgi:hypothetical protein